MFSHCTECRFCLLLFCLVSSFFDLPFFCLLGRTAFVAGLQVRFPHALMGTCMHIFILQDSQWNSNSSKSPVSRHRRDFLNPENRASQRCKDLFSSQTTSNTIG